MAVIGWAATTSNRVVALEASQVVAEQRLTKAEADANQYRNDISEIRDRISRIEGYLTEFSKVTVTLVLEGHCPSKKNLWKRGMGGAYLHRQRCAGEFENLEKVNNEIMRKRGPGPKRKSTKGSQGTRLAFFQLNSPSSLPMRRRYPSEMQSEPLSGRIGAGCGSASCVRDREPFVPVVARFGWFIECRYHNALGSADFSNANTKRIYAISI